MLPVGVFDPIYFSAIIGAASARGVPLTVKPIENTAARKLYGSALVLVRPDGHVACRGDAAPVDAAPLMDRVRGASGSAAACRAAI